MEDSRGESERESERKRLDERRERVQFSQIKKKLGLFDVILFVYLSGPGQSGSKIVAWFCFFHWWVLLLVENINIYLFWFRFFYYDFFLERSPTKEEVGSHRIRIGTIGRRRRARKRAQRWQSREREKKKTKRQFL